jgi:hypothetical protein
MSFVPPRAALPRVRSLGLLFPWILAAESAPPAEAQSTPGVLYEQDFAAGPALAARSTDVVRFDLEPSPHGQTTRTQFPRYGLEAGTHTICLDADDPFLTEVVLEDGRGKKLLRLHPPHGPDGKDHGRQRPRKPQCAQVRLASATYTIRVEHDGGSIAGAHRVAFAQPMPASPRLADDAGAPLGGYWALRPDPSLDPRRRLGRVIAPPPDRARRSPPFDRSSPTSPRGRSTTPASFVSPTRTTRRSAPRNRGAQPRKARCEWLLDRLRGRRTDTEQRVLPRRSSRRERPRGYRFELGVTRRDNKPANFLLRSTTFSETTLSVNFDQRQPDPAAPAALEVLELQRRLPHGRQPTRGEAPSRSPLRRDAHRGRSRRGGSRRGVSIQLHDGRLLAQGRERRLPEQCPPEERQPRRRRHQRRPLQQCQLLPLSPR